ncbi:MAG: hypothetical protein P8Z39_00380 [Gammaproteobacteria bacterium]
MARHIITLAILLSAILLYFVGASISATALVILGVAFEVIFWFRLFGIGHSEATDRDKDNIN